MASHKAIADDEAARRKKAYWIWAKMRSRARTQPELVSVCPQWETSFDGFLADLGVPAAGQTLNLRQRDGHYTPQNAYWGTRSEKNNSKRNCIVASENGETLSQLCARLDLPYSRVYRRVRIGKWPIGQAIELPAYSHPTRRASHD